jgi:flagellar biosynthetic protein FlhB
MAENDQERTEAPTPRRRQEARQQGNVARSMDLTAAIALLAAVLLLDFLGTRIMHQLQSSLTLMLGPGGNPTRVDDAHQVLWSCGRMFVAAAAPLVLGLSAVALLATLGQVGFLFTTQSLEPNWSRLDVFRGLAGLFNARSGLRAIMSLAKVAAILALAGWLVIGQIPAMVALAEHTPLAIFQIVCGMVYSLALKLAALLLILGLADYGIQYWQRERDLRMTKQELKEELKRMDGDPAMRQRRLRVARQLILQRLHHAVPRAHVVVTNPTHYAVALRYEPETMKAPKVVAKGADLMAQRIRQLAAIHGVPLVERRDLARALYRGVDVGREVPPQFYHAVAETLAYVYRLSGRRSA